jgi:NADPH:quinone reductase
MKAATIVDGALKISEHPDPEPAYGQLLVRVRAAGLNNADLIQRRGGYPAPPDAPPDIPGLELAGEVSAVGPGVMRFKPGDRVMAVVGGGAQAELALVHERLAMPVPQQVDWSAAGGFAETFSTAYDALFTQCGLAAGDRLLVHGAAGGVGTASLQVAKGLGARTIAVVSSDEKEQVAREAGADEVVRSDGAWKDEAKEVSGGGVDIVIDPVGGDRFTDSLRSLREGGRVVVVGFTGGSIPEVRVNRLLLNNTEVIGAGWGAFVMGKPGINREIGDAVNRLVDEGFVRPIVGARFPFERASEALRLIDERGATGKVVLELR